VYRDPEADPEVYVCVVSKTTLSYRLRCIEDLHASSSPTATGWSSGVLTNRNRRRKAPSRLGPEQPITPSAVGSD